MMLLVVIAFVYHRYTRQVLILFLHKLTTIANTRNSHQQKTYRAYELACHRWLCIHTRSKQLTGEQKRTQIRLCVTS